MDIGGNRYFFVPRPPHSPCNLCTAEGAQVHRQPARQTNHCSNGITLSPTLSICGPSVATYGCEDVIICEGHHGLYHQIRHDSI
ncbi:hypothetical protein FKM82_029952 [Ascaphus truei]